MMMILFFTTRTKRSNLEVTQSIDWKAKVASIKTCREQSLLKWPPQNDRARQNTQGAKGGGRSQPPWATYAVLNSIKGGSHARGSRDWVNRRKRFKATVVGAPVDDGQASFWPAPSGKVDFSTCSKHFTGSVPGPMLPVHTLKADGPTETSPGLSGMNGLTMLKTKKN